jgi:hypothetical protein
MDQRSPIRVTIAVTQRESFQHTFDRWTSGISYVATAPDEAMLRRFPSFVRTQYVPNAIPDRAVPTAEERARARATLGSNCLTSSAKRI